jgi:hypothetical protein
MKKLKERWEITSNFQLIIICVVFAITGSLAVWLAKPIFNFVGFDRTTVSGWIFWPIRKFIGALFGQFQFFWKFEKKMLYRLGFKQFKNK